MILSIAEPDAGAVMGDLFRMIGGITRQDIGGLVFGAVVGQHKLPMGKVLGKDRIDLLPDKAAAVIDKRAHLGNHFFVFPILRADESPVAFAVMQYDVVVIQRAV